MTIPAGDGNVDGRNALFFHLYSHDAGLCQQPHAARSAKGGEVEKKGPNMLEHVFPPEMMLRREEMLIKALSACAGAYYDFNVT
ncbi:MAG: hypothetical protein PUB01_03960 [Desulfovibrionaceae bacterium]|nr:hypothetical protein [Desulfovibrionaceae bacterium]